ncbi:hypothetical protein J7426_25125, partial [Tropicibacter sp. R16_0]|uniref:hypothetical protein n=1 Tax=Tropicibacter sp. R16_0 TaxID=2821102 RepID=UPI001ADD49F6
MSNSVGTQVPETKTNTKRQSYLAQTASILPRILSELPLLNLPSSPFRPPRSASAPPVKGVLVPTPNTRNPKNHKNTKNLKKDQKSNNINTLTNNTHNTNTPTTNPQSHQTTTTNNQKHHILRKTTKQTL